MLMTTATSFPTLESSAVAGKYAYALMLTIPPGATELPSGGREVASILSGDNVVVADYSEVKDLAFAFLKLLTDKDPQIGYQKTFGDFPTNVEALAAVSAETEAFGPIAAAAKQSFGTPFVGSWSQIQVSLTEISTKNCPSSPRAHPREHAHPAALRRADGRPEGARLRADVSATVRPAEVTPDLRRSGSRTRRDRGRREPRPWWMIAPLGVLLTVVILIPAAMAVWFSLLGLNQYTLRTWTRSAFVGLSNYQDASTSSPRIDSNGTSVFIAATAPIIVIPLGVAGALATHTAFPGRGLVRSPCPP